MERKYILNKSNLRKLYVINFSIRKKLYVICYDKSVIKKGGIILYITSSGGKTFFTLFYRIDIQFNTYTDKYIYCEKKSTLKNISLK